VTVEAFEKARAEVGVIDTMIGFPAPREEQAKHYDFIRKQTHDSDSQEWEFPAQYMFKGVPHYDRVDDPVEMLMEKMNRHGISKALTGMAFEGNAKVALDRYPDRFIPSTNTDPNQGMDAVRKLDHLDAVERPHAPPVVAAYRSSTRAAFSYRNLGHTWSRNGTCGSSAKIRSMSRPMG